MLDALVWMTVARDVNHNSLRSAAVRLYGIWAQEGDDHVRGCVGTLIAELLPELRALGYTRDFMQGAKSITLDDLERAASTAAPNPDAFLAHVTKERAKKLRVWSAECKSFRLDPGRLADAGIGAAPTQGGQHKTPG